MRLNENGINFRNEVNLLNPKELFVWFFGMDHIKGSITKIDGIKIKHHDNFALLNKSQMEKTSKFFKKYREDLPVGIYNDFKHYFDYFEVKIK